MSKPRKKVSILDSLNPKNWGIPIYTEEEFSDAFAAARKEGEKQFFWNGNRYHTKLISKKANSEIQNDIKWLKDFYTNYEFTPNFEDSIDISINVDNKYIPIFNSLNQEIKTAGDQYRNGEIPYEEYEALYNKYDNYYKDKKIEIDSLLKRLPITIKQSYLDKLNTLPKLVVTTEPNKKYNSNGYYDRKNNKLYSNLSPYTTIHELEHYVTSDRNIIKNTDIYYRGRADEYTLNPREISARALTIIKALEDNGYSYKNITDKQYKEVFNKYFNDNEYMKNTFGDLELFNLNNPYK